jgi:hypothetical protein
MLIKKSKGNKMNNKLPILDIQKIRKYENIKLEIFSMSLSEMKLTISLIILVYMILMLTESMLGINLIILLPFSIPLIFIIIKLVNKIYGKSIIFYMIENFKNK